MTPEMAEFAREAYGWDGDVAISPGPRGALGRIWRVEAGPRRYALKEIYAEPPTPERIAAELSFTRRAAAEGVRIPAVHPDRAGNHLVTTPQGRWLRLYDWVDMRPADLTAPTTPPAVGTLLARLHRCAPAVSAEVDGTAPHPWYDRVPDTAAWQQVTAAATPWAGRIADRLPALREIGALATPVDPAATVLCHRDLHPENVLADPAGELVVVDWDNFGAAPPRRELAGAMCDWFADRDAVDLDAVRAVYAAYLAEGGPARITELADFSMLIAARLNFLVVQARVALDPATQPDDLVWAEREIAETLHLTPSRSQLETILDALRAT